MARFNHTIQPVMNVSLTKGIHALVIQYLPCRMLLVPLQMIVLICIIQFAANLSLEGLFENYTHDFHTCCIEILFSCSENSKLCYCNQPLMLHRHSPELRHRKTRRPDPLTNEKWDKQMHTRVERDKTEGKFTDSAKVKTNDLIITLFIFIFSIYFLVVYSH